MKKFKIEDLNFKTKEEQNDFLDKLNSLVNEIKKVKTENIKVNKKLVEQQLQFINFEETVLSTLNKVKDTADQILIKTN